MLVTSTYRDAATASMLIWTKVFGVLTTLTSIISAAQRLCSVIIIIIIRFVKRQNVKRLP